MRSALFSSVTPHTKLFLCPHTDNLHNSKVLTSLCKHCPLETKSPKKQRNKQFNNYLYSTSIHRENQNNKITLHTFNVVKYTSFFFKRKKNITYNLNITYSPDGTYTTTIKINTNKPNITYYKHVHVTVITNTSILCYGERKENGNITMPTPAF